MAQDGPNGASSTLHSGGAAPRSGRWRTAQAEFLAGRTLRRAPCNTRNTQKSTQNADRATRRNAAGVTVGSAADTFGKDEQLEVESDDDHEVPEPPIPSTRDVPASNAHMILAIMKDMDAGAKQMFLALMTTSAAAVPIEQSDKNQRPPFSPRIMELATAGVYLERSIFTNEHIKDMFVNQSDPKYQPKKRTIINDEGKTTTVYTIDPAIFDDEIELSHIRFDEAHTNYRWWFVENTPVEAAGQLEAYNNHRQRCRDVSLVDEKDYVMVQRWCRDWMKHQTWKPTTWNEEIYHKKFESNCARYFESKVTRQMEELGKHTAQRSEREQHRNDSTRSRPTHLGPERTSSSSYPERHSPYSRDCGKQQRSFRKDTTNALCLKCGETGHMARECRAAKTVKGGPLKIFFEGGKIFWISEPKIQTDARGSNVKLGPRKLESVTILTRQPQCLIQNVEETET
ncbi:hypothetical protein DFH09DRAFT_1091080 [Mycena vulgaris]|nr:hypothetical protein DFH09DRAFT_1091080 [Mycena vulgaris]